MPHCESVFNRFGVKTSRIMVQPIRGLGGLHSDRDDVQINIGNGKEVF